MKYNYFFTAAFSFFLMNGLIAQEAVSKEGEPQIIQTISVRKGQPQQVHDKAYYEQRIREIDELLEAIEAKSAYIKSHENESRIAAQNGWFDNMERVKEESLKYRSDYEAIIKKMTN